MEILEYKREFEELSQKLLDAQEKIYHLEQFKKTVDEASIFSITDADGIITEVNKNFEEISGYTKEELLGSPHSLVRHEDIPKRYLKRCGKRSKRVRSGEGW